MRFLFVGSDTPGALERYCEEALISYGHEVSYYDVHTHLYQFTHFQQTPVLAELERAVLKGRYNKGLIRCVKQTSPDVVFVFKGAELRAETVAELRSEHRLLVNWNPDSPFDYGTTNTNQDVLESIPHYDVYFIWDRDLIPRLKEHGARRAAYLPFGYSATYHHPTEQKNYDSDVCFVGAYTPERAAYLEQLAHLDLAIWGLNWEKLPSGSPLHSHIRGGFVWGHEMSAVFSSAKIVMNFIRDQNGDSHNMRTFEVLATRSLMLSTHTRDQQAWFPNGEGAVYFSDHAGMVNQAEYYLQYTEERLAVARRGYELVTQGQHTYADRMREFLNIIQSI